MADGILLRVRSPFVVAGEIADRGELVEVTVSEAKDLVRRGVAELVQPDVDGPRVQPRTGLSVGPTMAADDADAAPRRRGGRPR